MLYLAIAGALFLAWFVLVMLFTPAINYRVLGRISLESPDFLYTVQATCQAAVHHHNRVETLLDGERFYPAMLAAIRDARRSINLECYIYQPGRIADQFSEALAERARAGVAVAIVLDAVGSALFAGEALDRLEEAGCRVHFYRPVKWYSLARLNNRTHRELLVVDGMVAFIGGAGIADWWAPSEPRPWRDLMARVEGPVVAAIQGVFMENWMECCGEILTGERYFPDIGRQPAEPAPPVGPPAIPPQAGRPTDATAFLVKSSPADRVTVSRVVFQMLIENAHDELVITTPYFLPDRALRRAFIDAAGRGVRVSVLVPGAATDQRLVRLTSRRLYGQLLEAGIRIHEYDPAMLHLKLTVVDDLWSVLGTANFDNRSFEHNDEVNIAMRDRALADTLLADHGSLCGQAREVTLTDWRNRPLWEKVVGPFIWLLERQQ